VCAVYLRERFLFRCYILNSERAKPLWSNVDLREVVLAVSGWRFDLLLQGLCEALRSRLDRLPLEVLVKGMDTLQICLDDLNILWGVSVHFHVQLVGKGGQIHRLGQIKLSERLHIHGIESISEVLESNKDLVFSHWEQPVAALVTQSLAERLGELEELLIFLVSDSLLDGSLVVESEEVLQWLLNSELLLPLQRLSLAGIVDVHEVACGNTDAEAVPVRLVDASAWTILVLHEDSPVLHKLNGGWAGKIGRAALRAVVQNGHLQARVLLEVPHCNGRVDWVIVCADILVGETDLWKNLLILFGDSRVVDNLTWLHFETVGVGPEFALWVEAVEHLEVDGDILALVILDRNGVKLNVELDESLQVLREQNFDERALLVALVVGDGPLFHHVTLLIRDVGVDFTELLWQRCLVVGQEDEAAFAPLHLKLDFRSVVDVGVLVDVIDVEHLMCQVLLEVDSEHLGEVLLLVSVLEEDLRLIIDTLNLQELLLLFLFLHFFFLLFLFRGLIRCVFQHFDDEDLIWLNNSLKEHLIIGELLSILLPVLLFEDIGFDIDKCSDLVGPDVGTVVV